MKHHELVEVREGCLGAYLMKYTLIQNVGLDFRLLTHQVVDDGLLITSLICIATVESSSDVGVVVLLPTFLVGTARTNTLLP